MPQSSYSGTRLLLNQPLGLSDTSSVEEREDKILSKLSGTRDIYLMAALNPIFNVNFELMPQYMSLTEHEQMEAQKSLMIQLYQKVRSHIFLFSFIYFYFFYFWVYVVSFWSIFFFFFFILILNLVLRIRVFCRRIEYVVVFSKRYQMADYYWRRGIHGRRNVDRADVVRKHPEHRAVRDDDRTAQSFVARRHESVGKFQ